MSGAHPALAAVAARPLDDLVGEPGDQRDAEDPRGDQPVPGRQAERGEDEDRDDHDDEQEARAAARVKARVALGARGRQAVAGLEAGDRLVLRAVVLEDPAQVAEAADRGEVADEDRGPEDPSTSQKSTEEPSWSLIRLVAPTGTTKNRPIARTSDRAIVRPQVKPPICARCSSPSSARAGRWPRSPARGSRSSATRPARRRRGSRASAGPGGASPRRRAAPS